MEIGKPGLQRFNLNDFKAFVKTEFTNEPEKQEELLDIFDDFSKAKESSTGSPFSEYRLSEKEILEAVSIVENG